MGGQRLLWFVGLYLGGLAVFALLTYALRALLK